MKLRKGISKGAQLFRDERIIIKKTYEEAFEEFILSAKIKGRSEDTIRTYTHHCKYFIEFIGKNFMCSEITLNTLQSEFV